MGKNTRGTAQKKSMQHLLRTFNQERKKISRSGWRLRLMEGDSQNVWREQGGVQLWERAKGDGNIL